ncbi:aminotransferase class V-fold PLP-dependent enzyme [Actinobacillus pleuropneumoniae]|uniref:aminotransferase class V-fold PLP-dependent enzyme n=1 Tax=Actinobacillus pleuropneumoniae TaxID=715 RepID=UPI001F359095|nr:cysteine desulfurase [Actinobacillus pleuropneumoniae]UKH18660.1 cysteine desulfurase [Actinobacillus pleuropneumoniae]
MNMQQTEAFRSQFPFFQQQAEWGYLDSAATTLKPQILIDSTVEFYASAGSVHRSQYDLIQSRAYERARDLVASRFNAESRNAVIWTSGTTHAINLVAYGLEHLLEAGDEIVISVAEHHANFIPWQQLAQRKQAKLIVLPLDANFQLNPTALTQAVSERTKIVALNLVSNVTGVRQPVERLIPIIRRRSNAKILLDCAQAVCCEKVDVQKLDADFYAFSAHKMYGPTGVGVLTGKLQSLEQIRPLFFGGKMLEDISESALSVAALPYRLEAGTPNIAGIIGFGKTLEWLEQWDFNALNRAVDNLADEAYKRLKNYKNIEIFSQPGCSTISFAFEGIHHADIAAIMTESKIALRSGEHCAKPYLRYLQQRGTLRISLVHYTSPDELDKFFKVLDLALDILLD